MEFDNLSRPLPSVDPMQQPRNVGDGDLGTQLASCLAHCASAGGQEGVGRVCCTASTDLRLASTFLGDVRMVQPARGPMTADGRSLAPSKRERRRYRI